MTTALIDGDIFLYRAASRSEKAFDWGDELWSLVADLREAKGLFSSEISEVAATLDADNVVIAVSDPRGNFRHKIWPLYKGNRTARKPLCFRALREWSIAEMGAVMMPDLEADDVLGILATGDTLQDRSRIVVTVDKDLKSVPGRHWNPDHPELGVVTVTKEEADWWHLSQTMSGDHTDGYSGIPGIGPAKAKKLLETNGATWKTVVDAYESKELGENEALLNARLAKILTAADWNAAEQKPIYWNPIKETL